MSLRKILGLTKSEWEEVQFIVKSTRDSLRHLIAGMRQRTSTGEYIIVFTDRSGMAHKVRAISKDLGTRDRQLELYARVLHELDLPHHCYQCQFTVTGDAEFFSGEDDESTWDIDEDEDGSWSLEDDDEGWDTDDDDDEGW
jgi:hypothetical protein